jgi:hypothetical protein
VTETRLRGLIADALAATRDMDDSRAAEPYYAAVLEALLAAPSLRATAVRLFTQEIAAPRTLAADLIAYCMHTLRWPEIRDAVTRLSEPQDTEAWRRKAHDYRDVLRAYSDDWRGRSLYVRYSRG